LRETRRPHADAKIDLSGAIYPTAAVDNLYVYSRRCLIFARWSQPANWVRTQATSGFSRWCAIAAQGVRATFASLPGWPAIFGGGEQYSGSLAAGTVGCHRTVSSRPSSA